MKLALSLVCITMLFPMSVLGQNSSKPLDSDSKQGTVEVEILFDGSSLDQFRGYKNEKIPASWKIDDGALMYDGSGGGDIITKNAYENFELMFDWKVSPGANSGVMYRVTLGDFAPYVSGPEYQILDDSKHGDGKREKTSAAAIYAMYAPKGKSLKTVGEWNTAKIVINRNRLEHWLNGKMVASTVIGSDEWDQKKAASKFKDWKKFGVAPKGHIAFQDHGDKVWFRNIRIKNLGN